MMLIVLQQELLSLKWDIKNKDFEHAEWHLTDLLKRVKKELDKPHETDSSNT